MTIEAQHLKTIEQRLLWLSHWMIHNANHIRPKVDGIKVGGHQASSASMVSIMTALRPEDRVAVKPHASPTLAWFGSVAGHRSVPVGVEHFGQTGTISDLYRHYGIDAKGIQVKVAGLTAGRPPARRMS